MLDGLDPPLDSPQTYATADAQLQPTLVTGVEWLAESRVLVSYMYHGIV